MKYIPLYIFLRKRRLTTCQLHRKKCAPSTLTLHTLPRLTPLCTTLTVVDQLICMHELQCVCLELCIIQLQSLALVTLKEVVSTSNQNGGTAFSNCHAWKQPFYTYIAYESLPFAVQLLISASCLLIRKLIRRLTHPLTIDHMSCAKIINHPNHMYTTIMLTYKGA